MDDLVPTKESIKVTKTWIMSKPNQIREIALYIRDRVENSTDIEHKVNIIYLIHDILYHSLKSRKAVHDLDEFANAFEPHLGSILRNSYSGQSPEIQDKISRVVKLWDEKKIYEPVVLSKLEEEMHTKSSRSGHDGRDHREHRDRGGDHKDRDHHSRERHDDRRERKRSRERDYDRYDSKRRF